MAVVYVFNTLIYPDEFILFIPFAVSIFIFGLGASHLMKLTIKKYRMLRKKFASQIINLSAVGIFFFFYRNLYMDDSYDGAWFLEN